MYTPKSWPVMAWIFAGFLCFFASVLVAFVVDWLLEFSGIRERWERARRRASERVLVDGESHREKNI